MLNVPFIQCFLPCVDDASRQMRSHNCLNIFFTNDVFFYIYMLFYFQALLLIKDCRYLVAKPTGTGLNLLVESHLTYSLYAFCIRFKLVLYEGES